MSDRKSNDRAKEIVRELLAEMEPKARVLLINAIHREYCQWCGEPVTPHHASTHY